ncbi:MAG: hypothetical protein J0L85_05785 [Zoogloea sp.]|nr:hypothetical protein [Zoogloea sp.]MCA0187049.1 hypothetical protein [Pseudomonadota bacterium]
MAILASNIALLESERMTDAADGGGRMTSREIPDGVAGNIFPKVSRLDSTYGRINLRQVFGAVRSANTDTYAGSHAVITSPPANDRIGILLFSTGSHNATRTQLRDWIESYVVGGPLSRMRIYGGQAQGQRALLVYQREDEPLPDVGSVLMLSVEAAGYTPATQFVRIESMEHEVRTFTDANGDFVRRVISLKITTPLSQTFPGNEPSRYSADASPTKIRVTQVADTARYYGITNVAEAIQLGALNLRVSSIYAPLVPATERETPVSLAQPAGTTGWVAAGAPITVQRGYSEKGTSNTRYTPTPILPGSWSINASNFGIRDNGDGTISGLYGTTGTIDYETGATTINFVPNYSGSYYGVFNQTYTPAVAAQARAHTHSIPVTLQSRGLAHTYTCSPLPAPGSVVVEYRALGKWYRLKDDGSGTLSGNGTAEGGGSIAYSSGALVVTLGALPDVDTSIIVTWGSPVHFEVRAGATAANPSKALQLRFFLANTPVKPGSVSIGWRLVPSTPDSTYTDAGGTGVLTCAGYRSGTINYSTGEVVLPIPNKSDGYRPGLDTYLAISYQQGAPAVGDPPLLATVTVPVTTPAAWNCGVANITPKSVRIVCPIVYGFNNSQSAQIVLIDNGSGSLVTLARQAGSNYNTRIWWDAGQVAGTIDYTDGDVTLVGFEAKSYAWQPIGMLEWTSASGPIAPQIGDYQVTTQSGGVAAWTTMTETLAVADIGYTYDLTATTPQAVVPGSVYLTFPSTSVYDRNGALYYAHDSSTNTGTLCGTIDYATGQCRFTGLPPANSSPGYLEVTGTLIAACLTTRGEFSVVDASFRTAGSPIRHASLYVQATALDGTVCSGTADVNGNIVGTHIRGTVSAVSGVVSVEFGDLVSSTWQPRPVWPSTIRYSCTVLSNLPLDASILGLDPVRLPSDGRVPMVRPADVCVIHETLVVPIANPAVAGATISSGRSPRTIAGAPGEPDLIIPAATHIEIRDAAGQRIPTALYTVDLDAGSATLANPLVLTGYTQPLSMFVRWEDMALVSDAQINGSISISSPTLYAYSDAAYMSTALLFGDLVARVEHVFDQQAWTNVWADTVQGSAANGELNVLQYPIEVLNAGAIKQRWRAHVTSVSPLTVQIHGEDLGLIGTFNATADIAPVNPLTGEIYMVIRAGAWGAAGAWAVGNNVRWNTVAAAVPIDMARTILAGAARTGDSFYAALRGDVD